MHWGNKPPYLASRWVSIFLSTTIARAAIQVVDDTMDGEDKNVFKVREMTETSLCF